MGEPKISLLSCISKKIHCKNLLEDSIKFNINSPSKTFFSEVNIIDKYNLDQKLFPNYYLENDNNLGLLESGIFEVIYNNLNKNDILMLVDIEFQISLNIISYLKSVTDIMQNDYYDLVKINSEDIRINNDNDKILDFLKTKDFIKTFNKDIYCGLILFKKCKNVTELLRDYKLSDKNKFRIQNIYIK